MYQREDPSWQDDIMNINKHPSIWLISWGTQARRAVSHWRRISASARARMARFTPEQAKYLSQMWTMTNRDDENSIIQQFEEEINIASKSLLQEFVGGHKPFLYVRDVLFAENPENLPYCSDTIDTDLADEDGQVELILQHMRNRRHKYECQNPGGYSSLSWNVWVV
eukprot:8829104-Karenia_brevis.AAC.1